MHWLVAAAPLLIAWGAWRGARRLLNVAVGLCAGSLAAARFGPLLHESFVELTGRDTWARAAAAWLIVYLAVAALAAGALGRLFRESRPAERDRWFRLRGAAVGAVASGLLLWGVLGNLSEVALETLPERKPDDVVDLRKPFEILRACRTFSTLTPAEADHLAGRPEVVAVLDNEAMENLLRTPGVLRRVSRAAEGDWTSVASLASDEAVKTAMHDPIFLQRVRQVDALALADEIERFRTAGESPHSAGSRASRLPNFVSDPQFVAHAEREWSDQPPDVAPPSDADRTSAYWRNVGTALDWYEGKPALTRILPHLIDTEPPAEK